LSSLPSLSSFKILEGNTKVNGRKDINFINGRRYPVYKIASGNFRFTSSVEAVKKKVMLRNCIL